MKAHEHLANRLLIQRMRLRLTQRDVAVRIKCDKQIIYNLELGRPRPDLELICRLAKLYGVTTDYLFGLEPLKEYTPRVTYIA